MSKIGAKRGAYKNRGRPLDPEHREHISLSLKGNTNKLGTHHSDETKAKIGLARKGIKHTEETKAIIREKRKLQVCTLETRAKMSAARMGEKNHNYGKKLSDEQKKFLSEINSGEKHPKFGTHHSEETRKKISEATTGKYVSPETRKRLSESHIGLQAGEKNPNWIGGATEYCHKFKNGTFRNRVRAFWGNVCQICGEPTRENESLDVHHVYYNKKACCDISPDGKYYTDLGLKGHAKDFEIVGDPNKFIPLHHECHSITTAKAKREYYARWFEKLINDNYEGRSFFTEDEYKELSESPLNL